MIKGSPVDVARHIQQLIHADRIRITFHARSEMDKDDISTSELMQSLLQEECELIEDYPEDRRGHSHLLLCKLTDGSPVHICCAVHEGEVIIITVYRPDGRRWSDDWRVRT